LTDEAIVGEDARVKRQARLVAAIVFWLMALAQLLRILFRVEVTAGGVEIPLWIGLPAVVVLGALSRSGVDGFAEPR